MIKFVYKEYIKLKTPVDLEKKKGAKVECEFLNNAESIIFDLLTAKSTYLQVKYSGFTEEEIQELSLGEKSPIWDDLYQKLVDYYWEEIM